MPRKKKAFIDKKNSVSFKLVHRSQRDPLIVAENHERVLMPIGEGPTDPDQRREEQIKYGVLYDDDYDYLQHLRDVNELASLEPIVNRFQITKDGDSQLSGVLTESSSKLVLPSTVFESEFELETGLLNQAAPDPGPHPDWDPDIVAALDDDFDFGDPDNEIEDNFVELANSSEMCDLDMDGADEQLRDMHIESKPPAAHDADDDDDDDDDDDTMVSDTDSDSEKESVGSSGGFSDPSLEGEETRSRFTEYSMTSSVIRRSKGLKMLDEVFEKFYEQYDLETLGELEDESEDIAGFISPSSDRIKDLIDEYFKDKEKAKNTLAKVFEEKDEMDPRDSGEPVGSEFVDASDEMKAGDKWDCESVLSKYSNLYNRPALIKEPSTQKIRVNAKTGLPENVLRGGLSRKALHLLDSATPGDAQSVASSRRSVVSIRPKNESSEDRRSRKHLVREQRKERREEKKANKLAFKNEELKQKTELYNAMRNASALKL